MILIDRDALIEKLVFISEAENQIYGIGSFNFTQRCMDAVKDAPTIEAVEVVRCKDCQFGHSDISIGGETAWICGLTGHVTTADGYCDEGGEPRCRI